MPTIAWAERHDNVPQPSFDHDNIRAYRDVCYGLRPEGANDVSKVVATLVGSGVTNYRRAILFGTICTAIGAFAAVFLAQEVAVTLTKGLIKSTAPVNELFALAALVGAMAWVLIATRVSMPVSTLPSPAL